MPKARKQKPSTARSASRSNPLSKSNANAKKKESSESPPSGKRGRHEREPDTQRTLKEEDRNEVAVDSAHCVKAEGRDGICFGLAAEVKVERKRRSAQRREKRVKDEDGSEDSPKVEQDEEREADMEMHPKLEDGVKTERKDEEVTKQKPGSIKSEQHDRPTGELPKGGSSNYLIQACISSSRDPTVTRLLSLPPDLTFHKLHEVLQIAFGWANCHPHRFDITDIRDNPWYPARLLSVYRDPIPLHDELAPNDQKKSK